MTYILYAIYLVLIIGPVYLIWAIANMNKKMKKIDWLNSQEYTLLRIDVPRNNDKSPMSAEQMFAALHGIFSESAQFQNHLSFEIVSKDKYIQFYIYLPIHLKDFVEGQIYAQYPTVEIHEVDDYAQQISVATRNYAICELGLNKPDVYPIRQFTDFEVDPISGITSVMSKLNTDEEVWVQFVIRPIGDEWQEKGHSMVNAVRSGKKFGKKNLLGLVVKGIFSLGREVVIQAMKPGADTSVAPKEVKLPAAVEEALKGIEQKITKLGFETKIRIMALGNDPVTVKMKCQNIAAAFKQYNTTNLNGFKLNQINIDDQASLKDYLYRSFESDGVTFNISELASLYHFPHSSVATPNIVWSGSKKGEPPANLPLRENVPVEEFTVLGNTNFRNEYKEFGIKTDDRRRHIYIIGKSGTGKSTLIENMVYNDINSGRGVILVDPHGDTVEKIIGCIPDHRINDVVVFDPSDREFPIAFNLLEWVEDDFKTLVASGFVGIFKKLFGESWGPRMEHILRNTVLALLDYPNSTMLDIPKMLTNNRFRDRVVEKVKDSVIREFWINEFGAYDAKFRTEAVAPILNKVGQFLATSTIRNIVGQPRSSLDVRKAMDEKKVILVNLSRGRIGEDNSALLGAMMITKIQLAAMSRADVDVSLRPDCFLYVDEFQNFATDSFATILSEARKYNLSLTMAHQYIAQMPEKVRDAVFGNAGTLISFRVGGADADALVKEYAPVFDANDMVNLEKFHIYIKLLVDGLSVPAFSARTLSPVAKATDNFIKVMNYSHEHHSRPRAEVEEMLNNKGKEEEDELRKEAEIFKTGGLEALLLKKNSVNSSQSNQKSFEPQPHSSHHATNSHSNSPAAVITPRSENPANDTLKIASMEGDQWALKKNDEAIIRNNSADAANTERTPTNDIHMSESEGKDRSEDVPRAVKFQNILDGKLYKERTARGNVKWYVGEEIDEEKLLKSNLILDDNARKMIELSKKVSSCGSQNSDQKHDDKQDRAGDRPKNEDRQKGSNNGNSGFDRHNQNSFNIEKKPNQQIGKRGHEVHKDNHSSVPSHPAKEPSIQNKTAKNDQDVRTDKPINHPQNFKQVQQDQKSSPEMHEPKAAEVTQNVLPEVINEQDRQLMTAAEDTAMVVRQNERELVPQAQDILPKPLTENKSEIVPADTTNVEVKDTQTDYAISQSQNNSASVIQGASIDTKNDTNTNSQDQGVGQQSSQFKSIGQFILAQKLEEGKPVSLRDDDK